MALQQHLLPHLLLQSPAFACRMLCCVCCAQSRYQSLFEAALALKRALGLAFNAVWLHGSMQLPAGSYQYCCCNSKALVRASTAMEHWPMGSMSCLACRSRRFLMQQCNEKQFPQHSARIYAASQSDCVPGNVSARMHEDKGSMPWQSGCFCPIACVHASSSQADVSIQLVPD